MLVIVCGYGKYFIWPLLCPNDKAVVNGGLEKQYGFILFGYKCKLGVSSELRKGVWVYMVDQRQWWDKLDCGIV